MRIDPEQTPPADIYRHLISTIVPRPIAWVSTVSKDGIPNLAPYSFFTGITSKPPTLCIAVGNKRGGVPKDTARNAIDTGELVVNVVPTALAEQMVLTSGEYPADEDEFAIARLETVPSERVAPPRVMGSPAQFECTTDQVVEIADDDGRVTNRLVIARIRMIHLADEVVAEDGFADPRRLDPLGRLGRQDYTALGELRTIPRPVTSRS